MAKVYGDRWEVRESLGEGGQAHAFLVGDLRGESQTRYVLKRLKNIDRLPRFAKEIEAVRNLNHQFIVRLVDFFLEVPEPYLVTEYCAGGTLLNADPAWFSRPVTAFELFQQVCEAVAFAHSQGIIHRDIKPANIFLREKHGPAVVGDFGICYFLDDGTRITLTEEAVGPRNFMAPELEDGRLDQISPKSDTYSLGKLLYWLLSGGKVFAREKHRDPQWDLKVRNDDAMLGWTNIYMEHANRLLDLMITADAEQRRDINNILILSRRAARLIGREFTPISKTIRQPCTYCGQGEYKLRASTNSEAQDIGFSGRGAPEWRILVCNSCGHIQAFRIDMASNKEWWS